MTSFLLTFLVVLQITGMRIAKMCNYSERNTHKNTHTLTHPKQKQIIAILKRGSKI